jgi:hypothetical protein
MKMTDFDYMQLDKNIRGAVRWFHEQGYTTTDSGDGSKFGTMECAKIPEPHVIILYEGEPGEEVKFTHQLFTRLTAEVDEVEVEMSYLPRDGIVFVLATGNGLTLLGGRGMKQ